MSVVGLLILLIGGWGMAARLLPAGEPLASRLAHAWLLGALALSLLLALLGGVLSGIPLIAAVSVLMLAAGLPGCRQRPVLTLPDGPVEWALWLLILGQCLFLARYAHLTAIGWDGLVVWEIKARIALANGGSLPLEYFSDATRVWSHPDYPVLFPMLETWVYLWIGNADQSAVRIIFPCFYLAALLLIYSGIAELSGNRRWALLIAALLFFIPFSTAGLTNAFTGYADFPLSVFYLAAVIALLRYFQKPAHPALLLFAITAAACPWVKREGAILWACLMIVAGFEFLRRRKFRLLALAAAPGLVLILAWKAALFAARAVPTGDFFPVTAANVGSHLDRIPVIVEWTAAELISIKHWSLLWPLFAAAVVVLAVKGKRATSARLLFLTAVPLAIYSGIYILSTWHPFWTHLDCSLARLVSQVALAALLAIGLAF